MQKMKTTFILLDMVVFGTARTTVVKSVVKSTDRKGNRLIQIENLSIINFSDGISICSSVRDENMVRC
ncbi:unnamed protein product [Meloidogyne enterolobii]|uniref:Uncharacterized protein n=1 Tax=Meloidogyne enterolobii TaxID=390850 RepID=A0ACB0YPZ1_MELEN